MAEQLAYAPGCVHGVPLAQSCPQCGRHVKAATPWRPGPVREEAPAPEVPLASRCPRCGAWGDHECPAARAEAHDERLIAYLDLVADALIRAAPPQSQNDLHNRLTRLRNR